MSFSHNKRPFLNHVKQEKCVYVCGGAGSGEWCSSMHNHVHMFMVIWGTDQTVVFLSQFLKYTRVLQATASSEKSE